MVHLPIRGVHTVGKPGVDTVASGFAFFIDGQKSNLEILFVLILFNYAFYPFLTGLLGRFTLSH